MSKVTFTHASTLKHRDLADAIKSNCEVTVVGVNATILEKTPNETYDKHLPEGITAKLVDELSKYHTNFAKSQHIAVSELSADIFNENSDINTVEAKIGVFSHGDFSHMTVTRAKPFANNKAKEGEPSTSLYHLHVEESTTYKGESFKTMKKAISHEFRDRYIK